MRLLRNGSPPGRSSTIPGSSTTASSRRKQAFNLQPYPFPCRSSDAGSYKHRRSAVEGGKEKGASLRLQEEALTVRYLVGCIYYQDLNIRLHQFLCNTVSLSSGLVLLNDCTTQPPSPSQIIIIHRSDQYIAYIYINPFANTDAVRGPPLVTPSDMDALRHPKHNSF